MERINIYMTQDLRRRIKLRSQQVKKTEAEVIRSLLETGLENEPTNTAHVLSRLSQLGIKGGPSDLALNHDKYLYEDE